MTATHVALAALSFGEIARALTSHGVDVDKLVAELEDDLRAIAEAKTPRPQGDAAVVLQNDDVTPYALVVELLREVVGVAP